MRLIKTKPRYRCDFCNHRGVAATVQRHELICWRNPNRDCPTCRNKGYYFEEPDPMNFPGLTQKIMCPFCSQFDPAKVPPLEKQPLLEEQL